jgi:hypothetical protein
MYSSFCAVSSILDVGSSPPVDTAQEGGEVKVPKCIGIEQKLALLARQLAGLNGDYDGGGEEFVDCSLVTGWSNTRGGGGRDRRRAKRDVTAARHTSS